jgi:hypothetical protein
MKTGCWFARTFSLRNMLTAGAMACVALQELPSRATEPSDLATPNTVVTPGLGPVRVGEHGIACRLWSTHGSRGLGPPSYRVQDIGKSGVPTLNHAQLGLINEIERYVKSTTLWFALTPDPDHDADTQFIIFDTATGPGDKAPCSYNPPGYAVLNLPGDFYYESGEAPFPTAFCCEDFPPKRPWITLTPAPPR